ncbi:MAG: glycosyltransferase family 2 protein [Candidatus Kryptoniota bacterium]
MIILFDIIFLVPSLLFALYLAFLTLLAMTRRSKPPHMPKTLRRFAVMVPAHNEESVIEKTLRSLKQIYYPTDKFDIVVIADNCTDRTAAIAREMNVVVLERFDAINAGKGYALRWCMEQLIDSGRPYDAFVVIDADTVVSTNILSVMNGYLEDGAECIQCSDMVVSQPGAWSPEMTRVAFILHNFVRPLGKMAIGWSAGLNGNGMCFSRNLIENKMWSSYSRVEDLEHSIQLLLENIKIQFAPEATVRAIMPTDPRNAETQRKRWEMGRFALIRKYALSLIAGAARKRSSMILDSMIDLITPALVNLFLFTAAGLAVNILAVGLGASWLTGISLIWAVAFLLEVFHVIGGLSAAHADRDAYTILLNFPKYAVWKLKLYLKTLLSGDDKHWVRTARDEVNK